VTPTICGIKTTHDGAIAVISAGELLFSYEAEKFANRPRNAWLADEDIPSALARHGLDFDAVDAFVVDGWVGGRVPGVSSANLPAAELTVAAYIERGPGDTVLEPLDCVVEFFGRELRYSSYSHAAGHVAGAYCSSPFAHRGEDSLVLVWDGGMTARLYAARHRDASVHAFGEVFPVWGNAFPLVAAHLEPFRLPDEEMPGGLIDCAFELTIPGKAMAYAGLGEVDDEMFGTLDDLFSSPPSSYQDSLPPVTRYVAHSSGRGLDSASTIATFQAWVGSRLVRALERRIPGASTPNLCMAGGCALNITWNNAVRSSGLFAEVWVPPFPNDSGSALGTAAAEMMRGGAVALRWDVYLGASVVPSEPGPGWRKRPCSIGELAAVLHETGEPVVVLQGRAELGPRALGNRSVLCAATDPGTRDRLNEMKHRAWYRPVAPVCLESCAPDVFDPGTPDPFMLFTHRVRERWRDVIPAVVHVDGTARLQTVNHQQHPILATLLEEYRERSGIPLLCNTSANLPGRGFFPDAASAMEWGEAPRVWQEGRLFERSTVGSGEP
jgi:carbamoyltransferase